MSKFEILSVLITDRCSASCRMCCFGCTPAGNMLLDENRIKDYISQAAEIGTPTVAFSGGEAVMHYRQLKSCIQYAHDLGLKTTLMTNGFWAKNPKGGYKLMKLLAEAGLLKVSISIDKFHQEFVPVETVKNAIRILKELNLMWGLTFMDNSDGNMLGTLWDDLRPEIYGVAMDVYPLLSVGAAREYADENQYMRLLKKENAVCPSPFRNEIVIHFDGRIMPCCSTFSHEIPILTLGHYDNISLREAIKAMNKNSFLYLLFGKGFKWFLEQAESLGYTFMEYYGTPCELCHDIFANAELCGKLAPLVKAEADRMRLDKLFGRKGDI
jgi:MoaA/NifB/PqqE/SkfB family radical SAM enzyme